MREELLDWLPGGWKTIRENKAFPVRYAKAVRWMAWLGRELSRAGALPGASGNFSVRLGRNVFVITPQGGRKGELTDDSLISVTKVDWSLKLVRFISPVNGAQPSSDALLHKILYNSFSFHSAIVHMHKSIKGHGVTLPYPVVKKEEADPLITAIWEGERVVNLLKHRPEEGGNGASIIVGEDMEETFRHAIRLATG